MGYTEQGKRLRLARQAAGLTQTRLGQMAGVTKQTVCNFELGHKAIHPSTVERLEQAIADYVATQKIAVSLYAQREQQAVEQEIERLEQRAEAFRKFQHRYSEAQ